MMTAGLTEADCAEVDVMLEGLRRQRLIPHHPDRLRAVLEAIGAHPHEGNARVAQNAIFRGYAAALRQTERRWDGAWIEGDRSGEEMLRSPALPMAADSRGAAAALDPPIGDRQEADVKRESPGSSSPTAEEPRLQEATRAVDPAPARMSALPADQAWLALAHRFADEKAGDQASNRKSRKQPLQIYGLFAKLPARQGKPSCGCAAGDGQPRGRR